MGQWRNESVARCVGLPPTLFWLVATAELIVYGSTESLRQAFDRPMRMCPSPPEGNLCRIQVPFRDGQQPLYLDRGHRRRRVSQKR